MKIKDPVCGMEVKTENSEFKINYKEKTYHFCTALCMVTFEQEPEKYAKNGDTKKVGDDRERF